MAATVVSMRSRSRQLPKPTSKPAAQPDDIFFTKEQIKVGTVLRHMGRLDPESYWEVTRITSYFVGKTRGSYNPKNVPSVRHLSDDVVLVRLGSNESRQATFGYLSYSAIWRLGG